jgi:hypothetical protein
MITKSSSPIVFALAFSCSVTASAVHAACESCSPVFKPTFPETGSWYSPEHPGTGLNLEIQDGYLLGFYYGYDESGVPIWFMVNGPLVASNKDGVRWAFEGSFQVFEGGNCPGCTHTPPGGPQQGLDVKLEFSHRASLNIAIGSAQAQQFVPLIFGSRGNAFFREVTSHLFPEYGAHFAVVFKPNETPPNPAHWDASIVPVNKVSVIEETLEQRVVTYQTYIYEPPPGPDVLRDFIECRWSAERNGPYCQLFALGGDYVVEIEDMSDTRFFGVADDGSTVEGYRLDYD